MGIGEILIFILLMLLAVAAVTVLSVIIEGIARANNKAPCKTHKWEQRADEWGREILYCTECRKTQEELMKGGK